MTTSLVRRSTAEFIGAASLAAAVIGSGIAATRLSEDAGIQLLINAVATVFALFALITVLGAVSGAHLNPVVSIVDALEGRKPWRDVLGYAAAQVAGCIVGAVVANLMFGAAAVSISASDRVSPGHLLAEVIATGGLVFVIFALVRTDRIAVVAPTVAAYIGAAYFVTSSTSFANPAITIGRMLSDSFAGIAPASALPFIAAQLLGGAAGYLAVRLLIPRAEH